MSAVALDSTFPTAAKRLSGRPIPTWSAEVLGIPARWMFELPVPPRLALHVPGVEGIVHVTCDGELDEASFDVAALEETAFATPFDGARRDDEVVFDGDEWRALVRGVEADRVWPADLVAFCRRKAAEPAYRLELEDALGGGQTDPSETWGFAAVLSRMGAELLSVELD